MYDLVASNWHHIGAFYEAPLMVPTARLDPEQLQRFWQTPDMLEWDWPAQEKLLKQMLAHADEYFEMVEHGEARSNGGRDPMADSGMFPFEDRFALFSLVSMLKPARIIEIGSGDSTKVVNLALRAARAKDPGYKCTHQCIEPYRASQIGISDNPPEIIAERLEKVGFDMFEQLQHGDMLFIDSSHVIKPFGDVILELVHILPRLKPGVIVHIHDIVLPFYLRSFLEDQHRHYAEADMLAAFLYGNTKWEILFSNPAAGVYLPATAFGELRQRSSYKGKPLDPHPGPFVAPDGTVIKRSWAGGSIYIRRTMVL